MYSSGFRNIVVKLYTFIPPFIATDWSFQCIHSESREPWGNLGFHNFSTTTFKTHQCQTHCDTSGPGNSQACVGPRSSAVGVVNDDTHCKNHLGVSDSCELF